MIEFLFTHSLSHDFFFGQYSLNMIFNSLLSSDILIGINKRFYTLKNWNSPLRIVTTYTNTLRKSLSYWSQPLKSTSNSIMPIDFALIYLSESKFTDLYRCYNCVTLFTIYFTLIMILTYMLEFNRSPPPPSIFCPSLLIHLVQFLGARMLKYSFYYIYWWFFQPQQLWK